MICTQNTISCHVYHIVVGEMFKLGKAINLRVKLNLKTNGIVTLLAII